MRTTRVTASKEDTCAAWYRAYLVLAVAKPLFRWGLPGIFQNSNERTNERENFIAISVTWEVCAETGLVPKSGGSTRAGSLEEKPLLPWLLPVLVYVLFQSEIPGFSP